MAVAEVKMESTTIRNRWEGFLRLIRDGKIYQGKIRKQLRNFSNKFIVIWKRNTVLFFR